MAEPALPHSVQTNQISSLPVGKSSKIPAGGTAALDVPPPPQPES